MNKKWKRDDLIVRSLADSYLPIALVLGFYVILHGNISPGGGFQGGVLAASGVRSTSATVSGVSPRR